MLAKKIIRILPKIVPLDLKELRELYERVKEFYLAA